MCTPNTWNNGITARKLWGSVNRSRGSDNTDWRLETRLSCVSTAGFDGPAVPLVKINSAGSDPDTATTPGSTAELPLPASAGAAGGPASRRSANEAEMLAHTASPSGPTCTATGSTAASWGRSSAGGESQFNGTLTAPNPIVAT